ncbi:hypothetical protein [Pseudonocardia halophobica]|uniref:hypothetical protein n=1 Tax=Pseudonocardia halophobica TaxID=29401 RepID=UPI0018CC6242|nr:hypothetical protein [Pseudonocardia halophobica]
MVLALVQLAAPPVISALGGGAFTTADRAGEPAIVPAGYAFSIWLVIELLSLLWALWAAVPSGPDPDLRERIARPLTVVFAGFTAWLVAAELEPRWATFAVFLVMLAGLLAATRIALREAARIRAWSGYGQALLWGTLGLYLGWSSVAIWLNLTTALVASGAPLDGSAGLLGQLAVLAGATATAVALLRWTGVLLPYLGAVVWALAGAMLGARGAGEPVLAFGAAVGLVVVIVAALGMRRRGSHLRWAGPGRRRLAEG